MLDLSRSIRGLVDGMVEQAKQAQQQRQWEAAARAWDEAARLSLDLADSARSKTEKEMRLRSAGDFREHAKRARATGTSSTPSLNVSPTTELADTTDELVNVVRGLRHKSEVRWDHIAGLEETVRSIKSAYALSIAQPPQGVQLRRQHNFLFWGPPGCGKSLLAAAASNGLDAAFYNVPVSGLMSKWFGESAKLVSALYRDAREQRISIVFLDELDALAGRRDQLGSNASRQILANLLSELDGVATKNDPSVVLTIAATNSPWDLDDAILSRFARRVFIPLPDRAAREQMLRILLTDRGFHVAVPMCDLLDATNGASGRELEQICQALVERMLWRENPNLSQLALEGRDALSAYTVSVGAISAEDVGSVLERYTPQTSPELMRRYHAWNDRL